MTPDTSGKALPARAQVVIIGGGVIGCSIAYHLAHLGCTDVVLLERHQLTAGTTWHAAGLITSAGMTDETVLSMSRYSRDLYERLEQETGHSTGFRAIGHISVATTPRRLEALRRASTWMHGYGVDDVELSPREIAEQWPLLRTDDLLAGFYVADEGRADPVGVATSLAKGAKQLGVRIVEGVSATGVETKDGRVTAVLTDQGRVETETLVNAGGAWARQFGALTGVHIPLQAAEHYYLITEKVPGMDLGLPVVEDPDNYSYYRPEGDGMLVGLFEPVAKPWHVDGLPTDFAFGKIAADWTRMEPYVEKAMARIPCLADIGVRTFFCGPESFTSDVRPLLGPAPEIDGYWVAAGLNSIGILLGGGVGQTMAHWILEGVPDVDVTGYAIDRVATYETSPRFRAERTVEQLGALIGDAAYPTWKAQSARNIRRTVLHDRFVAAGAHFNSSFGWEFPEWFAEVHPEIVPGFGRQATHPIIAAEHKAVREGVGIMDMTLMAKILVQGKDSAAVLSRLSANDVAREVGRVVYTQWLNTAGGIVADVTVTRLAADRFLVVASDIIHRRIEPLIRRETRKGEVALVTDVTSATTLFSVQGPASRTLLQRLTDADLSNAAFPYLTAQQIHVGYAPVTASRVTYVGELGWELNIPTEYAAGLYDDLIAAGADLGCRPIGLAAMSGLRLEKGYRDMGVDIDNTDNPIEAGLGFAVAWDKLGGFIGRDALVAAREASAPIDRVVGIHVANPDLDLYGLEPVHRDGVSVGYVRAAAFGHTLGGPVGLAQVHCDAGVTSNWLSSGTFTVRTPSGDYPGVVQVGPFYDPARLRILAAD